MNERLSQKFHLIRGFTTRGAFPVYTIQELKEGGYINSKSIDVIAFNGSQDFRMHIERMFLITKFIGGVLPITSHRIDNSGHDWSIMLHDLEYLIKLGKQLKLNFYRFKDFIPE